MEPNEVMIGSLTVARDEERSVRVGLSVGERWRAAIMELSLMDKAASFQVSLGYLCDGRIVGAQSGVIALLARSQSAPIRTLRSDGVRPGHEAA
jgi:hypothetical protein